MCSQQLRADVVCNGNRYATHAVSALDENATVITCSYLEPNTVAEPLLVCIADANNFAQYDLCHFITPLYVYETVVSYRYPARSRTYAD